MTSPRALTPELRARLGIPPRGRRRYPWPFAALIVGVAAVPLVLASMFKVALLLSVTGLVVIPLALWYEGLEREAIERVYRTGAEAIARVTAVEPGGPGRTGHVVRLSFFDQTRPVNASLRGCPFARRGLSPGDDVVVYYDPGSPKRCLVVERVQRRRV